MTLQDQPSISIIIPTLNESLNLHTCLTAIPYQDVLEVIICDGGSYDDTLKIAHDFPIKVMTSSAGRATQMNAAARVAKGEVLLFLHADTIIHQDAITEIIQTIRNGYAMGCFERKFASTSRLLTVTSRWAGWRARQFFIVYGDQAIFLRRDLFESLNGYRDLRRFEDLDLALRAKSYGRWAVLPTSVLSDARRFGKQPLTRIIKDAVLTVAWLFGVIKQ